MKKLIQHLTALLFLASPLFAQYSQRRSGGNGDAGAACGIFACGIFVYLIVIALCIGAAIVIDVVIFKFIRRDSIARGLPPNSAMPWLALLGLLGLLIYVLQRPQGNVMPCPACGKNRMQGLPRCPNCGNP